MACGRVKTFFFSLWALAYAPFIYSIPVVSYFWNQSSGGSGSGSGSDVHKKCSMAGMLTVLFYLANAVMVEWYLLFRLAQTVKSARLCTRNVFGGGGCRRRRSPTPILPTTAAGKGKDGSSLMQPAAPPPDSAKKPSCPLSDYLARTEDGVHRTRRGQFCVLVISAANLFYFSVASFQVGISLVLGATRVPEQLAALHVVETVTAFAFVSLSVIGGASFIPYLAFRLVMAIGFLISPYGPRASASERLRARAARRRAASEAGAETETLLGIKVVGGEFSEKQ